MFFNKLFYYCYVILFLVYLSALKILTHQFTIYTLPGMDIETVRSKPDLQNTPPTINRDLQPNNDVLTDLQAPVSDTRLLTRSAAKFEQTLLRISLIRARLKSLLDGTKCLSEQKQYIERYGVEMARDEYNLDFIERISNYMAILYQEGIDRFIPKKLNIETNEMFHPEDPEESSQSAPASEFGYVWNPIQIRRDVICALSKIMKEYGTNYNFIQRLLEYQQISPFSEQSQLLKFYLFTQKHETDYEDYYWGGQTFDSIKANAEYDLSKRPGFPKAIEMYKAFTAIVLNTINIANVIFHGTDTCVIQRAFDKEQMSRAYPGVYEGQKAEDTIIEGIKDDIVASTFIGPRNGSHREFIEEGRTVIHTISMPFSRIFAVYFMSPELCCDYNTKIMQRSHGDPESMREKYMGEHEVICDCSHIQTKFTFV